MKKRLCVHFSLNHLTFNKVNSWWPRVSQLFVCSHQQILVDLLCKQTIFLKSEYLKYHSLKASDAIYEHCKHKHTNNETQFGEHYKPSKNIFDRQRPSNQQLEANRIVHVGCICRIQKNELLIYCMFYASHLCLESWLHPYECGDVSECWTWMMIRECLKVFWSLKTF
jgi:hypothetical protein